MLRTNLRKSHGPVYREVVKQAALAAWHERRLWPIAFIASFLFTAGAYDILWKAFDTVSSQGVSLTERGQIVTSIGAGFVSAAQHAGSLVNVVFGIQFLLIVTILIVAIAAFACVSQGALIYTLGVRHRGESTSLTDALRVGGKAFWPIAALNAITLSTLWVLRFLSAVPLAMNLASGGNSHWVLYFFSFIIFCGLQLIITIVQTFAMNAMILQGASAAQALIRGYDLFKRHWVVAVETAILQTLIAIGAFITFCGLIFIAIIPIVMAIITSAQIDSAALYYLSIGIGFGLIFLACCTGIAVLTQFQYATWTYLYRRLGEGGVIPKLHRIYRAVTGRYSFEK